MKCDYCEEEIDGSPVWATELSEEEGFRRIALHRECQFRMVMGSVAHQQHRCSCFVPGSTAEDPPEMTLREGARAAFDYYRKHQIRSEQYAKASLN